MHQFCKVCKRRPSWVLWRGFSLDDGSWICLDCSTHPAASMEVAR